jgi:hypothetical protein
MATSVERRVARLETATDGGDRCPECGFDDDHSKIRHEVVFMDPDEATPDEWCGTCGRQLICTIHMDWEGGS